MICCVVVVVCVGWALFVVCCSLSVCCCRLWLFDCCCCLLVRGALFVGCLFSMCGLLSGVCYVLCVVYV